MIKFSMYTAIYLYVILSTDCMLFGLCELCVISGGAWQEVTCHPETRDHCRDMRSGRCYGDHRSHCWCQVFIGQHG